VLTAKRLTLLHDLVPSAVDIAVLINPTNANADTDRGELQMAARAPSLRLKLLPASNEQEIDAVFAAMAQNRPAGLCRQSAWHRDSANAALACRRGDRMRRREFIVRRIDRLDP
jgi:ABC-type uncharacterized transport system substrate-binding protein